LGSIKNLHSQLHGIPQAFAENIIGLWSGLVYVLGGC